MWLVPWQNRARWFDPCQLLRVPRRFTLGWLALEVSFLISQLHSFQLLLHYWFILSTLCNNIMQTTLTHNTFPSCTLITQHLPLQSQASPSSHGLINTQQTGGFPLCPRDQTHYSPPSAGTNNLSHSPVLLPFSFFSLLPPLRLFSPFLYPSLLSIIILIVTSSFTTSQPNFPHITNNRFSLHRE